MAYELVSKYLSVYGDDFFVPCLYILFGGLLCILGYIDMSND